MLHVPTNIRQMQIPSPTLSPTVEQKDFIPKEDTAPIIIENVEQVLFESQPPVNSSFPMNLPVGSPNLQHNVLTQSMDHSQVSQEILLN